jgi:DNA-binding MarR family transcriptional regulator
VPQPPSDDGFDPLGRQLNVTARATRALLDAVLAEAGTTFSSWQVLAALNAEGPVIQRDLARELEIIGPSIVERIDQLEKSGHVKRSPSPTDRRASLVSLTPAGRRLYNRLQQTMRATEAGLTEGIPERNLRITRESLTALAEKARQLRNEIP